MADVRVSAVVFTFALVASVTTALPRPRRLSPYNPNLQNPLPTGYNYQTLYMKQDVDHFGFENNDKFNQRYLVANQFWNQDNGPIFFYTGNEGDITWFCNNTGFMWDIAPEFKALLVFAEHRYYGESLPYGSESYANASVLNYLTSEQALADHAELVRYIKQTMPGAANSPVIVFGGSYGGMLAAWMRMKYPNLVLGSHCGPFGKHGPQQVLAVKGLSHQTDDYIEYATDGLEFLTNTFSLCSPLRSKYDLLDFLDWLPNIYVNLAMVDYPYPASFLEPLPAWPVKTFCENLLTPMKEKDLLVALAQSVKMYFNYTGQAQCLNISQQATGDLGDKGWGYQACTEMVMPTCSNGTGMFYNNPWDFNMYSSECKQNYGIVPREDWIALQYWAKNITSATTIIFSNGMLDPWSGGGVLESLSPSLIAIQIPRGAHHLDLRAANPGDTADVRAAREQEKNILKNWLYQERK